MTYSIETVNGKVLFAENLCDLPWAEPHTKIETLTDHGQSVDKRWEGFQK